ncbi:EamA family transporter [Methylobrevis pamukkalensis]|uniref:Aromatic amino acid exporter n=1 Tax=Methylobrevis pamukkalensis TaxID=1439726 RepID=A0A1E3H1U1_9HYPH|nr:EamA family transporter [Methylobrevis pamukkalensis]ODN70299.1 aromatic amino acid exporter [Methylobrevis pamukkalensis]
MRALAGDWLVWALLSAVFAALTAILAKVGVEGVNPELATLIRTAVILVAVAALVVGLDAWREIGRIGARSWVFLLLSGLATGASWLCYVRALKLGQASHVAPVDKLSVVLVAIFGAVMLGETLSWRGWAGVTMIAVGTLLVAWR